MSAFSEYAAASEHNTALNRHTSVADLTEWSQSGLLKLIVPVSGDMLAVLKRGTRTHTRERRKHARAAL
ncbi:hypothetical protein FB468_2067 [Leucobacter komagatae]|uniref:Uncharacterized protein n=1 Tax=Leucobacter komagatae TaxID=55969 RepID=A0A542Y7G2_9MICO|nr:hypothetical protein [Leucobacter komagatae]TQL44029.1 hypothetical protein FB468_2067 [Leucobacter komagatae]